MGSVVTGARTRGKPKEVSAGLPLPRPHCSRQSRPTQSPGQEMGTSGRGQRAQEPFLSPRVRIYTPSCSAQCRDLCSGPQPGPPSPFHNKVEPLFLWK